MCVCVRVCVCVGEGEGAGERFKLCVCVGGGGVQEVTIFTSVRMTVRPLRFDVCFLSCVHVDIDEMLLLEKKWPRGLFPFVRPLRFGNFFLFC